MDVLLTDEILQQLTQVRDANVEQGCDDVTAFRLDSLIASIFKKLSTNSTDSLRLHEEALDRFRLTCGRLLKHSLPDGSSALIRGVRAEMHSILNPSGLGTELTLHNMACWGSVGPGKSIGAPYNDFLCKMFDSPLSTTSYSLYNFYSRLISGRWSLAEASRLRHHSIQNVLGSRFTTVPKDDIKRRTICVEPVLNMYFQLGAKEVLTDLLHKAHRIDVPKQQDINKHLAKVGSRTGRFATIDLSDASDSISVRLMQMVLDDYTFKNLDKVRCTKGTIDGENYFDLPMFSTMGNGFTFVLMTSLFSCIVRTVYHSRGIHPKNGVNYAVYGDDIICVTEAFDDVIQALNDLGFLPNMEKTFHDGPFRESCGGDYFRGHDVRPIFIKELQNEADLYSAYNRICHYGIMCGVDLSSVLGAILGNVPIRFVPEYAPINSGIRSPRETVWYYPRDKNGAIRYRRLVPVTRSSRVQPRIDRLPSLAEGAITAFLGGYIDGWSGTTTARCENPLYKVRKFHDPVWECAEAEMPKWVPERRDYEIRARYYHRELGEAVRRSVERLTLARLEELMKS